MTTETVRENLRRRHGAGDRRSCSCSSATSARALIVAINIPLALLFAFAVLFLRGKSANLLSIGAVDFGIIVDSLGHHRREHLPPPQLGRGRGPAARASGSSGRRWEVERSLFFSTVIMVCAMLPLFTMKGPGGADLRPDGRHLRLRPGRGLFLALTVSPVLCLLLFRRPQAGPRQLPGPLAQGGLPLAAGASASITAGSRSRSFGAAVAVTVGCAVPRLGREFMPELDEGHIWIRGIFPINISLDEVDRQGRDRPRRSCGSTPRCELVAAQLGRPDGGTDPTASTTSSSSSRSSRSRTGRPSGAGGLAARLAPGGRGRRRS